MEIKSENYTGWISCAHHLVPSKAAVAGDMGLITEIALLPFLFLPNYKMHVELALFIDTTSMVEKRRLITLYSFTNYVFLENNLIQSVQSYSLPSEQVTVKEAKDTLNLWYRDRKEVKAWQNRQKELVREKCEVYTLLGRSRRFPNMTHALHVQKGHVDRAAINAPVQVLATEHGPIVVTLHFFLTWANL
jgi:hypothetical protein